LYVNQISNKYASYPDWRISPHADPPKLHTCKPSTRLYYKNFSLFGLGGLTPGPKFTKIDDLLPTQFYHPAKFSSSCVNSCQRYPIQKICGQTNKEKNK